MHIQALGISTKDPHKCNKQIAIRKINHSSKLKIQTFIHGSIEIVLKWTASIHTISMFQLLNGRRTKKKRRTSGTKIIFTRIKWSDVFSMMKLNDEIGSKRNAKEQRKKIAKLSSSVERAHAVCVSIQWFSSLRSSFTWIFN